MCSGLLAKLVLCLMLLVYTSVRSLETGYTYTTEPAEQDELHKDLKCGYLFGSYTHMRIFMSWLVMFYKTDLKLWTGKITVVNAVVKSQIGSLLGGCRGIRIGALWLVHLFTSLIPGFFQDKKNTKEYHLTIFQTLEYVIGKLDEDLAECRKGNAFDTYDTVLSSRSYGFYSYRKIILPQYVERVKEQLENNNMISDRSLRERLEINMKTSSLLLNNLGMHDGIKDDMQNVYNLKIKWNDTSKRLYAFWMNARALDWSTTNLRPIKSYYNVSLTFFKIIVFRLTSKHMAYLRPYVDNGEAFSKYIRQWHDIIVQFGTMLSLSEDLHVKNLLHVLEDLVSGIENIDSVDRYIVVILVTLCKAFGCEASAPFVIDNREFTTTYKGLTEEETQSLRLPFSPVLIEYNSLANAKTFLSHLSMVFNNVNFTVIRSLVEYIDELNPTNLVERSDDRAEELKHLINISDFE